MTDEEAKAVQEVSKATQTGLDLLKFTGESFRSIFGESLQQFGGVVADWATYYRLKNFLKIVDKVDNLLADRQVAGKRAVLLPAFALPILDAASLESEEEVQLLWAGLLTNALDPTRKLNLKKIYVEILRGMQALDAMTLASLSVSGLENAHGLPTGLPLNAIVLLERVSADVEDVQISLQTLARYGCVVDSWENTIDGLDTGYAGFRVNNPRSNFRLSHLGGQLVKATSII